MRTYSTVQVARMLRVGRQTLHRWMLNEKGLAPRKRRLNGVSIRLWTARDVERAKKYKAAHYRKGRGRKKKKKA